MNKLYKFTEFSTYHVGFYDDIICIGSNIDEASIIIFENLNAKYVNYEDGIKIIKNEIKIFDLNIGIKK